ncbi:MAG TPA: aquaporin [Candidatus Saccharimonadales bacterium]|nr:aquaporin [Candidatus Saccharimonadales bacterium]
MFGRKKIAMVVAEFLGTGVLTLVVLGVSKSTIGIPYFIAIAAGLAVAAMTLALGSVSGAHLNPAITLGLWTTRKVKTLPTIVYIAAQLLGAFAAYWLYTYFIGQTWANTSGAFQGRVLAGEVAGTFIFSMAWAAAAYQKLSIGQAAAVIGMGLTLGIIAVAAASGGLLNPALALGTRMWVWSTYVLGPVLGAVIGFNLYALLFAPASGLLEGSKKKK